MSENSPQSLAIAYVHFYVDRLDYWQKWFQSIFNVAATDAQKEFPFLPSQSKLLKNQDLQIVLSAPTDNQDSVSDYLSKHPCGIADIAFFVPSSGTIEQHSLDNKQPFQLKNPVGFSHTIIPCQHIKNPNWAIDHLVLNVEEGYLEQTVDWYVKTIGFRPKQSFQISTNYSGLSSQVLQHPSGIQLPINQPGDRRSQIQEFLDHNRGAGIQHLAIKQQDISTQIHRLRELGLKFLHIPQRYYQRLIQQHPHLSSLDKWSQLCEENILIDVVRSPNEILLQIFTKPIFPEPTFFFEFIERKHQATGFGEGNFQALFEAIEQSQKERIAAR